jgi:1-acyl-sn-glycerol-3-phosphate acyltransferase
MEEPGRVDRLRDSARDRARSAAERGRELGRAARLDKAWARCRVAGLTREAIISGFFGPVMSFYARRRTSGQEHFRGLEPPVVLVANHSSHMDTPAILRALPRRWRRRTAVAAAADYFYKNRLVANLVSLAFNTVPLQRRGGGLDASATDHLHRLIDQRWNLLLYPEGTRSRDGRVGRLRSGAAVLAADHGISIVPIYVRGTHEAMPPGQAWPKRLPGKLLSRRHRVTIEIGEPIRPKPGEHRADVIKRVRAFYEARSVPVKAKPAIASGEVAAAASGGERPEAGERRAEPVHGARS